MQRHLGLFLCFVVGGLGVCGGVAVLETFGIPPTSLSAGIAGGVVAVMVRVVARGLF